MTMVEKDDWLELELWRGDEYLASAEGRAPDVLREMRHYFAVYAQDGGGRLRVMEVKRVPIHFPSALTDQSST